MYSSRYSSFLNNKTDRHNIAEILLKVALNTIILTFTKLLGMEVWESIYYIIPVSIIINMYMYLILMKWYDILMYPTICNLLEFEQEKKRRGLS